MRSQLIRIILVALVGVLPLQLSKADIPRLINYQGRLSASGTPITGTHTITFALYDAPENGAAIWSESHEVSVVEGVFNVLLGSLAAFPDGLFSAEPELYLGVRVAGEDEMTPRQRLASTPFSFQSASADAVRAGAITTASLADGAVTAEKLDASSIVTSVNGAGGAVTLEGAGGISVATEGDAITITGGGGGGGEAGVQAIQNSDNALTVTNPIGPTVTLDVRDGGITSEMLGSGAVTSATVADGSLASVDLSETAAVKTLNGLAGDVTFSGTGGATVTSEGNTITINAGSGGGASGVQGIQNTDGFLEITNPNGPTVTIDVQDGAVSTSMIDDGAVTASKIANLTITGEKLANNAITSSKIADGQVQESDLAPGAAVNSLNTLSGDVTLAGAGAASISRSGNTLTVTVGNAGGVNEVEASDGALLVSDGAGPIVGLGIRDGGIVEDMLADDAVSADKIANNAVGTNALAADAVTDDKIANGAVGPVQLQDGAVTSIKIGGQAVGTAQLLDDAVTAAKINDEAVTAIAIADGTITGTDIADGSIAPSDLASNAAVRNLNGLTGAVEIRGEGNTSVSTEGNAIVITTGGLLDVSGIDEIESGDAAINVSNPEGPTATLSIASQGISNGMLAANAVTSTKILDGSVGIADIGSGAVASDEIADGSIGQVDLNGSAAVLELNGLSGGVSVQGGGGIEVSTNVGGNTIQISDASSSSIRWKRDVETIQGALGLVERLRGVRYMWKETGVEDIGFIAEEIGQVIPEIVTWEENGVDAKTVNYARVVSVLVEALKEQQRQIEEQDDVLSELAARLARLEAERAPATSATVTNQ